MNDELKKLCDDFIASLKATFDKIDADLNEREARVAKKTKEVELIDQRLKEVAEAKQAVQYDRDLVEKERIVLNEKKEQLDIKEKRLNEKADRLQKIMTS